MGGAHVARHAWRIRVQQALLARDSEGLRSLYDELVDDVGNDAASQIWFDAVSAFDASAVTG